MNQNEDEFELDEDECRPAKPLSAERKQEMDELLRTISEIMPEVIN